MATGGEVLQSAGKALVVAAIDFGTCFSGYAYSYRHDFERDPFKIHSPKWQPGVSQVVCYETYKCPTCVLFDTTKQFDSFGYDAENKYCGLDKDHNKWLIFDRFKMMLYNPKGITEKTNLEAKNGEHYSALTVFAAAIEYLKKHFQAELQSRKAGLRNEDIKWVLTVPAIWDENAKQFMRKAADKAGIKERLVLALEPEAASIYCRLLPMERLDSGDKTGLIPFKAGTTYMVIDLGGGTVDVTVHQIQTDCTLKEVYKANGGAWGGCNVDEEFIKLLRRIFGEKVIEKAANENPADMLELKREFEFRKRSFGVCGDDALLTVSIPYGIYAQSGEDFTSVALRLPSNLQGKIKFRQNRMSMKMDVVRTLFEPAQQSILTHIKGLLKKPNIDKVKRVFMVGGFAESKFLQTCIRKEFPQLEIIVPEDSSMAVLKGAVIFGHDQNVIVSRRARYTYGTASHVWFLQGHHPAEKKVQLDGNSYCKDVFTKHIEEGDEVILDQPIEIPSYSPLHAAQEGIAIKVFASTSKGVKYVTDPGSKYLGQLRVAMPDMKGGVERELRVLMFLGDTEIRVEAKDMTTGKKHEASFECLPKDDGSSVPVPVIRRLGRIN